MIETCSALSTEVERLVSVCLIESLEYLADSSEKQIISLAKRGFFIGESSLAATILSDGFFDDYVPYLMFENELLTTHPAVVSLKEFMAAEVSPIKVEHSVSSLRVSKKWEKVRYLARIALQECESNPLPSLV